MKLVNLDEVFVKLQEISNPGHPHDSCKCGCGGRGEWPKKIEGRRLKKKDILFLMVELGNCAACLQPFHDSAQQHTCKGCGGKIHSSIICPKCPKVVDHEEDNSRIHGVHEENLPKHTLVGIQGHWCLCSHPWTRCSRGRWGRGKRWGGLKTS